MERVAGASPFDDLAALKYDESSDSCVCEASSVTEGGLRGVCTETTKRLIGAMDDDFNTGNAIAALFEFSTPRRQCFSADFC